MKPSRCVRRPPSQTAPKQCRSQETATNAISDRPPQWHIAVVIDRDKDRRGEQVRNTIENDQRAKAIHIKRQNPQRNAVHTVRVRRLPDKKHQHRTMRHHAKPKPFV